MKKKLLGLLLMMVLLIPISFGLSGMEAYADDGDYIKINNIEDLYNVRSDMSANYKLMCDIDLSEATGEGGNYNYNNTGWEPIGATLNKEYTGIFDGNGHVISGMTITGTTNTWNGLFWKNSGVIKNLMVKGQITYTGTPYNNYTDTGDGLIVGENNGTIANCKAEGSISTKSNKGIGLIASVNNGVINRCLSSGSIAYTGNSVQAGGICGRSNAGSSVSECVNTGDIGAQYPSSANGYACGIVGLSDSCEISNCYNTGTCTGYYYNANHKYFCTFAAGITARSATISNCYNIGKMKTYTGSSYIDTASHAIGVDSTIIHCYYLDTCGGRGDSNSVSLNESNLSMKTSFTGFDFDKVWELSVATDYKYPQLRNNMQDPNKHVDIIEWKSEPSKIEYYTDEDIDPTGGVFRAYYIDDTHEDIDVTKDMLSGYDMTKLGVQTVTVSFREGSLTYDILTSTRPEVKSLTLETMPDKTEFARGTSFDFTGATAKVEYVNGKTELFPITAEETTGGDITKSGTYTISFEKFGKTVTFDVKVVPVKPIGINIAALPEKTTYIEGQSLDLTGLVVKLEYNSGKTETITDYTVGEYENTIGTKEIAVTYENFGSITKVMGLA